MYGLGMMLDIATPKVHVSIQIVVHIDVYMFEMKNQMYFISKNVKSDLHYPKLGLFSNF